MNQRSDPMCACATLVDVVEAELHGTDLRLCPVHHADAVATQTADEVDAASARLIAAFDTLRPADELEARRRAKELEDMHPLERSLTLLTTRGGNHAALNARLSSYPALAGLANPSDDGPPEAA